mgnify:CR=1 FL=1
MYNKATDNGDPLQVDAAWLVSQGKEGAARLLKDLHLREINLSLNVSEHLASPTGESDGSGLQILIRGVRMLLLMLFLVTLAMLANRTLGLVVLFLTGAQVFATAYGYQVVAGETLINRRMTLLGILMSFALALLAFIGLFL